MDPKQLKAVERSFLTVSNGVAFVYYSLEIGQLDAVWPRRSYLHRKEHIGHEGG